ncbi:HAD family hydrolase [Chamaesiphon sp. VAR_69_metabat_338]|uniref:HAD family hydrolase n=1 Tax=Chamaesiphon sp. VAR_69_metabat_338 TaxID=2964704 RepID=UPI00286E9C24|nr:HAD family hydrolase [Chamaesiphon sp. VAR_69_metabat_338]
MRIITDFDGPIMDLSDRYYHVYQFCLAKVKQPNQPLQILTKVEFWMYKRAQVSERKIGIESGLTAIQAEEFKELRDRHAHQLQYLSLDRVVPESIAALARIQASGSELFVMTLRRTCELEPALHQSNLDRFFPPNSRYCLPDDYVKHGDVEAKTKLMATALTELPPDPNTWMVGDTEADIVAAKTHGIKVIGVLSGIRDRDRLAQYQPDKIVANLAAAVAFILDRQ